MREQSDETILLREAIKEALDQSSEPMTSLEIADHPAVRPLGLDSGRVSRELKAMHEAHKKPWPLLRIPAAGPGRASWGYFNPDVVKLAYSKSPVAPPSPEVNEVNPPEFEFRPVEFAAECTSAAPSPPEPTVAIPTGVKAITLNVAGVTIRIELQ